MQQQINFYRAEFRPTKERFGTGMLLAVCGVVIALMVAGYGFITYELTAVKAELKSVQGQEQAAQQRLDNFVLPGGGTSLEAQIEDAKNMLRNQELSLNLVQNAAGGDVEGFSRHLRSLASQDSEGLWLSYIRLSALGDNTRLGGQALNAALIPAYLETLAKEKPFARQRFSQFQIERPEEEAGGAKQANASVLNFSLSSEAQLLVDTGDF